MNILDREDSASASDLQLFDRPYGLIFLNLAKDSSIIDKDDDNKSRLYGVLSDLARILADNGSLVVALENMKQDYSYVERE